MSHADASPRAAGPSKLLLAGMVAAGPVALSVYVPALPLIVADLAASDRAVKLTVTLYFAAFALSQLVAGPFADALGRRQVALAGMVIYSIGGLVGALAPNVEMLTVGRMIQALGGAAGLVLARTIVSDLHRGERMAQALAGILMISAIAPVLAPAAGGIIAEELGWRATLGVMVAFGAIVSLGILIRLPETVPAENPAIPRQSYLGVYRGLLGNTPFVSYNLHVGLFGMTHFAFLTGMPLVLSTAIGLSAAAYGSWFMLVPLAYLAGNALTARMAPRLGMRRVLFLGTAVSTAGVALMAALALSLPLSAPAIFLPAMLMACGHGLAMSNASALAMGHVTSRAGTATAAMGAIQMASGAVGSALVTAFVGTSPWPVLGTMLLAQGIACLMILRSWLGGHQWL